MIAVRTNDFNLTATLGSGQVFGFERLADSSFEGVLRGIPVNLKQRRNELRVKIAADGYAPRTAKPFRSKRLVTMIRDYFDLDRNLSPVYRILREDDRLLPAWSRFKGLRLIRQDSWEALACFILSSNNNVKRIQGIWRKLVGYFDIERARGFPAAARIAGSHERVLRNLGLGYRAPFLLHTARFVAANPVCLEVIRGARYEEAVKRVVSFPGIGPKVADCVLLYGFQKYEAFPVDVWIERVMRKMYFGNRKATPKKIRAFAQKRWGEHAGYVQQYLFHGARQGVIELRSHLTRRRGDPSGRPYRMPRTDGRPVACLPRHVAGPAVPSCDGTSIAGDRPYRG